MSFKNLFIRKNRSLGGVKLDAVLSESHSNTVTTTENPIAKGADITDHSRIEPKQVVIVAQVSDIQLGSGSITDIVDTVTGLFGSSTAENLTRSQAAYNNLVQLMEQLEPIDIQTGLVEYENMLITSINVEQDKRTTNMVRLRITARELLVVDSKAVKFSSENLEEGTTREQATSPEQRGRVETSEPEPSVQRSVLSSLTEWLGG